jgi:hypothetical protein
MGKFDLALLFRHIAVDRISVNGKLTIIADGTTEKFVITRVDAARLILAWHN